MASSLVGIRFARSYPPYAAGEVAAFLPAIATRIVAIGAGQRVDLPKAKAAPARKADDDNFRFGGLDALGDCAGQV